MATSAGTPQPRTPQALLCGRIIEPGLYCLRMRLISCFSKNITDSCSSLCYVYAK